MSALATPSSTPFSLSSPSSTYTPIRELGRGTYGIVTLCTSSTSTTPVAIKRMATIVTSFPTPAAKANALKKAKYIGVSISALREVKILREFSQKRSSTGHPGSNFILPLLDCFTPPNTSDICAVYEFCPTDLLKVLSNTNTAPVTESAVKSFMHSLCQGVSFVHSQNVLHRDLKPDNLLFTSDNVMRIGDFGLARTKSAPQKPMSIEAITLWYKPPEMLLGEPFYSTAVDMWSVGCIFAELLSVLPHISAEAAEREPLFPGTSCWLSPHAQKQQAARHRKKAAKGGASISGDTKDQLGVIFNRLGTMTDEDIDDVACGDVREYLRSLPKKAPSQALEERYPGAAPEAIALLRHMVHMNPNKRCTVEQALSHPYLADIRCFDEETVALEPIDMAFDSVELSIEELRSKLHETVMSWHVAEEGAEPAAKKHRR